MGHGLMFPSREFSSRPLAQVCINVDSAEAPQEPPGAGFMWRHREDDLGASS